MADDKKQLDDKLKELIGSAFISSNLDNEEHTVVVKSDSIKKSMLLLRDNSDWHFAQLTDLCGVDYQGYGDTTPSGGLRFAVVYHILSLKLNYRLRVRSFCQDDEFPLIDSVTEVWPSANWFEREAFDLYGIHFAGHPDLRRLLTDYGFVGHPFRKDFPLSGYVEMRYDPEQGRVVYEPVTIEPREIVPRVIREEKYGSN